MTNQLISGPNQYLVTSENSMLWAKTNIFARMSTILLWSRTELISIYQIEIRINSQRKG